VAYSGDPSWTDLTSSAKSLVISNPDILLTAPPQTVTVQRGIATDFYLSTVVLGNVTGTISVACSGAPSESTCTVDPTTVQAGNSVHIHIIANPPHDVFGQVKIARGWTALSAFPFAIVLAGVMNRKRRLLAILLLALAVFAMVSCGGGGGGGGGGGTTPITEDPGTPVGNYMLMITTTYGIGANAVVHNYPFQMTVQ
jgi:hypothetical protein